MARTMMDAFAYDLPPELIAQEPADPRSSSRLLVALDPEGAPVHSAVKDLPGLLGPGDVLVLNDTLVLPARLQLQKPSGGAVEVLLLDPIGSDGVVWQALVRRSRRVAPGTWLYPLGSPLQGRVPASEGVVEVGEVLGTDGRRLVRLAQADVPQRYGSTALPPYIHQPLSDPGRYQTVYARHPGSVAAPTAGLHFDVELLEGCRRRGVEVVFVELSVGLDTFRPVTVERAEDHVMHSEAYRVPASVVEACQRARRVIAVGTTTVRALETAAATGDLEGRTSLFIHGDYPFRTVDALMTNFHMPRSSLLLMLAAFCGERWRDLYRVAIDNRYRFLSFGDAMVVSRRPLPRSERT
ncbi:MAG: tRNA preQ1(34) S-adenosylmethionine ribosyltransferase-isomerase QueA [Acidimicrobiales bacterium]